MLTVFCTAVINTMLVMRGLSVVSSFVHLSPKMDELLNHIGRRRAMADIYMRCNWRGLG